MAGGAGHPNPHDAYMTRHDVATDLGTRLTTARLRAGMTIYQLADRAGMSLNGVALIEAGVRCPRLDNALRLACACGVSLRDLLPDHLS